MLLQMAYTLFLFICKSAMVYFIPIALCFSPSLGEVTYLSGFADVFLVFIVLLGSLCGFGDVFSCIISCNMGSDFLFVVVLCVSSGGEGLLFLGGVEIDLKIPLGLNYDG